MIFYRAVCRLVVLGDLYSGQIYIFDKAHLTLRKFVNSHLKSDGSWSFPSVFYLLASLGY